MDCKRFDACALAARLARIRVLYTDLDGTVLGPRGNLLVDGRGRPSAATAETIVRLNRCDAIDVMPVTGRSVTQLIELARICGWSNFIAEAGAVLSYYDPARGVRTNHYNLPEWPADTLNSGRHEVGTASAVPTGAGVAGLPVGAGRTPLEIIAATGAFQRLQAAFPGQVEYHSPWNVNRQATDVLRGRLPYTQATALLADITPALALVENGVIAPKAHTLTAGQGPIRAYHLTPAGATKASAIAADLAQRGLTRDQAMMIGDGRADLECATAVDFVVMVENALSSPGLPDSIAAVDNAYVVDGCAGDGWVRVATALLDATPDATPDEKGRA
ncbi:MAG: hypothetical protein LBS17_05200 [Actinomycetes bacterium]|jgi:hydroxymethylpyrimidine pyrophosphatase-like HAD family hydrolase|nr:hypothetical protein [Actinomycetes bacterium]